MTPFETATAHAYIYTHEQIFEALAKHTATHCNTLQHTAIHCNTLLYTYIYIIYIYTCISLDFNCKYPRHCSRLVYAYIHVYTYMYTHIYRYIYVCIYIYTKYIYIYICVCVWACVHTFLHPKKIRSQNQPV